MSIQEEFDAVAKHLQDNPSVATDLPNEKKLEIYALYKQGFVGDVNTDRPGMFDLKGKAKWDAWNGKKGTPKEEAQAAYVELVKGLGLVE